MSEIPAVRRYWWSLRREWWENPAIYVVPLAAAALVIIGFVISEIRIVRALPHFQRALATQPYDFAQGLIMFSTMAVAVFYCLDTLYGERRDRSILFWKSLPVSDVTTVLAKATIPLLVLPLITFVATLLTFLVMMLVGTLFGIAHPPVGQTAMFLLYHLVTVHGLWWAPFFGWMLLISAWAKRAPFVWATVPVIGLWLAERIAFNTSYFAGLLKARFGASPEAIAVQGKMPTDPMTHLTPGAFITSPALWLGLAITALCIAAAVRLRRYRGPI